MKLDNFIGASYVSIAPEVNCEDCVNFQPENTEVPGSKAPLVLYGSPGTAAYKDIGNGGPIRGATEIESYTYWASGSQLFQQGPDDVIRLCDTGTIATGDIGNDGKPVVFAASATQLLVVSSGKAFFVSDRSLFDIAGAPWTTAIDCAYINGYFVVLDDTGLPTGGQFFISTDATTWDPLDFSTVPASNNKLVALGVDHGELWVYGTVITQVFGYNTGLTFPFVPNPSGVLQQGIMARDTRQQMDNTLFWIGRNKDGQLQAFLADGYTPHRITTHAVEQQWQKYMNPTDAVAWTYQIDGHAMYHVNFVSAQKSWRYDRSTNLWHRVAWRNPATGQDECHRGGCHVVRKGQHLVGDRQSSAIWELSPQVYSDNGNPLIAFRRAPALFSGNKYIYYPIFELITPSGIGNGTVGTPEEDPQWMLRWSNDNAHNFGDEFLMSAGPVGEYDRRVRKVGTGRGRNRVFEVSISAAVHRCLIGAEIPDAYVGDT